MNRILNFLINVMTVAILGNIILYRNGYYSEPSTRVLFMEIKDIIHNNPYSIDYVEINENEGGAYFYFHDRLERFRVDISQQYSFEIKLKDAYNNSELFDKLSIVYEKNEPSSIASIGFDLLVVYIGILVIKELFSTKTGNILSIYDHQFDMLNKIDTRFNDVIGQESVKQDLTQYIDFIRSRDKYIESGAKLPRGLILSGPPGTGKTLLAKAMAGEANVSFIPVSGSDFIEIFVGMGSRKIKQLFCLARKNQPCIIFIDEIDAIGRKRSNDTHNGHSEHASTLNKLLSEMDGFADNDNVMVIGATNMIKLLDPALTRSGRFDKKVIFDKPNVNERKELFKLYLNKIKLSEQFEDDFDVHCQFLAKRTSGMTGADISNISNQSIIINLKKNKDGVDLDDIQTAIDEVMIGMEKRERMMTKRERNIVAHHEAGHALVAYLLKHTLPPIKVSIVPRGEASLGYSQPDQTDQKLYTKNELMDQMCVLLGGRVAEIIMFDSFTTGASDDLEKLTNLAYTMITRYGMSNQIGCISYNVSENHLDISDGLKKLVDQEAKKLIDSALDDTTNILTDHKEILEKVAKYLLENEELLGKDMDELIGEELKSSV